MNSPQKIQDYLDSLPINNYFYKETMHSPRRVIESGRAHCMEGALFAAAVLWHHGAKPYILDLKTVGFPEDYDHVVALFKENGHWGAISKTNHIGLRYRDPIYKSIRELALSYFNEYFSSNGKKTLRSYSKPFDLSKLGTRWIISEKDLWDIEKSLDKSPHIDIISKKMVKSLRNAGDFEKKVSKLKEWK